MEFKGTKGEWEVVKGSNSIWVESPLWSIVDVNKKDTQQEQEANAKLIAAAPELLKALQSLQSQFKEMILDEGIDVDEGDTQAFNQATEAINKALK
mgnify:CR=1 FL=1